MSERSRSLSLAIVGTRGVPPRYGGFETFAGELSTRLVGRGHRVTVYCRRSLYAGEHEIWKGVRRIELPAISHKYLETVSHSLLSSIDAVGRSFDAILVCNAANAFVLPLLRAARIPVAINVDGIERNRRKWNALGRFVYLVGESFSARFADTIVSDAEVIRQYYLRNLCTRSEMIPYGSQLPEGGSTGILDRLGLMRRGYILYVSRFEPENNPLAVVESFRKVTTEVPLVMVGDAPYGGELVERVRHRSDRRVLLPGAIFGSDYRALQENALLYIQATEVGGTHPAMIEAMGSGGAVVANDTPENREVGGDCVLFFRFGEQETLSSTLQFLLDDPATADVYRSKARKRARSVYDWEAVTDRYEQLFRRLAAGRA